jgi:cell division protein FtsI/penicillin-binding protein 2
LLAQSPLNSPIASLIASASASLWRGSWWWRLLSLLIARLVHLQVVQHDYYTTRAEDNRISLVPIVPNRGVIVDRHGTVLARNYSAFTLEITPSKVDDLDATIEGLGKLIEVLPKDRKRFRKLLEESKTFESLPIRTRLTEEEVAGLLPTAISFLALKSRRACSGSIRWVRSHHTPSATSIASTSATSS